MKRNIYYTLIVLFILAACGKAEVEPRAATATQIPTLTPEPTRSRTPEPTLSPTPEGLKFIDEINESDYWQFERFSRITFDDFTSGRLLKAEKEWPEQNPFSDEVVPIKPIELLTHESGVAPPGKPDEKYFDITFQTLNSMFQEEHRINPESRPFKIISFYVLWDLDFFKTIGINDKVLEESRIFGASKEKEYATLGIMSWTWKNQDGSEVIGHSLMSFNSSLFQGQNEKEMLYYPIVDVYNFKENVKDNLIHTTKMLFFIYEKYPELKPTELSKEWLKTGNMPQELENKLFGVMLGPKWNQ